MKVFRTPQFQVNPQAPTLLQKVKSSKMLKIAALTALIGMGGEYSYRKHQNEPTDVYLCAIDKPTRMVTSRNSNMDEFCNSLNVNAIKLSSVLGINQKQYRNYAQLAIGIAKQETNCGLDYSCTAKKYLTPLARIIKKVTGIVTENSYLSEGLTNYKYTQRQSSQEDKLLKQLGIKDVNVPEQAAVATVVHLYALAQKYPKYQTNFPDKPVTLNEYLLTRWQGKVLSEGNYRNEIIADRTSDEPKTYVGKVLLDTGLK